LDNWSLRSTEDTCVSTVLGEMPNSVAAGVLGVVVPAHAVASVNTHMGVGTVTLTAAPMSLHPFSDVPSNHLTAHERAVTPHLVEAARVGIGHINVTRAAG